MTPGADTTFLALNLGSSTLKAARFEGSDLAQPARRVEIVLRDRASNTEALLADLVHCLGFQGPPGRIGHRIVHGGDAAGPRVLDANELARLQGLARLAPLHQPPALALVANAAALWPGVTQYGVFDTAWHAGLPANARRLPVPHAWEALGIRRYGFHGLAFASAMRALGAASHDGGRGRVVLAHLGGGASLCAVLGGRSIDTTMAMTPLEGLPMATRSGSIDPGALLFLLRDGNYTVDALEQALYRDCGLRGLSGLSGDVRDLLASGEPAAKLALDVFVLRVAQGVAAMATHLGGLDDLVFTGGVGSHSADVRARIAEYLAWLGVALDDSANRNNATRLGHANSKARIWRFVVDEEREIATACAATVR